jgi:hypothetical protein
VASLVEGECPAGAWTLGCWSGSSSWRGPVEVDDGRLMEEEPDGAVVQGAVFADGSGLKLVLDEEETTAVL